METTAKLTTFVVFILVGARVFSLTFYGVEGHLWVEHLLTGLPGGQLGFLIVVNILIFLLAFFLDFFELSFIVVPLLAPVAEKLGIDLIWFGVLLGVNMQTSFMHPPFGFALFYLRSVAPASIKTTQIYWGAVPFVIIQIIMVGIIIAFPQLVTMGLDKQEKVDTDTIEIVVPEGEAPEDSPVQFDAPQEGEGKPAGDGAEVPPPAEDDAAKALEKALQQDKK
jgi:TRAP-type mannitol/chloroaromatic compound transport system permease large subunit